MNSPTIAEVGRQAGVARQTVSAVLSGRARQCRISEETRQRVELVAKQLNYRPNRLVQSLQTGRTHMVAVMMPTFSGPYFARIATGVELEAKKHGYHVLLSQVISGLEDEVGEIEALLERRVDGLILLPRHGQKNRDKYRQLLREQFPLVLVDGHFDDVPASSVVGDDLSGMYLATEHLIKLGHRKIAHLAGSHEVVNANIRVAGYRSAMREHGLEIPEAYVQWNSEGHDDAYGNMQRLLTLPERPTAVTSFNDRTALEGIRATWDAGLRVPEDVAFVGYSDHMEDPWFQKVPLTSVRIDTQEMGRRAMKLLLKEMQGRRGGKVLEKLPAELVVRQSSGVNRF